MTRPAVAVFGSQDRISKACLECLEREGLHAVLGEMGTWEHTPADLLVAVVLIATSDQGLLAAAEFRRLAERAPLFVLVEGGSEDLAVAALRVGASDYFRMPREEALFRSRLRCVRAALETQERPSEPQNSVASCLIGDSAAMHGLRTRLSRISTTSMNVLITGETGTGKELAAATVHRLSARRNQSFTCINCAAIPDSLFESELFGHERGSFTGAISSRQGLLEGTEGGSVFLDEIGDLALAAQAKLLRVIENKEVRRIGGRTTTHVDLRFLAATHRELEPMVAQGKFRDDLYYRLNVIRIHLPPLRNRRDDIPALLVHYMRELNAREGRSISELSDEVWECLMAYDWPGNIRELKNLIEAAYANSEGTRILLDDLPDSFRMRLPHMRTTELPEREQLLSTLLVTKWNKSKAAEKLHWSRMTLYRKLAKYRIDKEHRL